MTEFEQKPKRFIHQRLDAIESTLLDLKRGLENMAKSTIVNTNEFEQIKYQVGSLSEALTEVEVRVSVLEKHNSMVYWIARQFGTIVLAVIIGYIVSVLF